MPLAARCAMRSCDVRCDCPPPMTASHRSSRLRTTVVRAASPEHCPVQERWRWTTNIPTRVKQVTWLGEAPRLEQGGRWQQQQCIYDKEQDNYDDGATLRTLTGWPSRSASAICATLPPTASTPVSLALLSASLTVALPSASRMCEMTADPERSGCAARVARPSSPAAERSAPGKAVVVVVVVVVVVAVVSAAVDSDSTVVVTVDVVEVIVAPAVPGTGGGAWASPWKMDVSACVSTHADDDVKRRRLTSPLDSLLRTRLSSTPHRKRVQRMRGLHPSDARRGPSFRLHRVARRHRSVGRDDCYFFSR